MIKLKDLLLEKEVTIKNPNTGKNISAKNALQYDDDVIVKIAQKALEKNKSKKSDDEEDKKIMKKSKISSNPFDVDDKSENDNFNIKDTLKVVKGIKSTSEKLLRSIKSLENLDDQLIKKLNHSLQDLMIVSKEIN